MNHRPYTYITADHATEVGTVFQPFVNGETITNSKTSFSAARVALEETLRQQALPIPDAWEPQYDSHEAQVADIPCGFVGRYRD